MALDSIIAAIEAETKAEIAEIRAAAATGAEKVLQAAREQGEQQAAQELLIARKAAAAERAHLLHQAQLESRRIIAGAQQELVADVLTAVQARLQRMRDDPGYPELFQRLVAEALQALGEEERESATLVVDPRDLGLAQQLGLNIALAAELECWGGAAARSEDGRIVVDNTLAARLEQSKPHLHRLVLELLDDAL